MKKRLVFMIVSLLIGVTCSAQVFAATALKPKDKETKNATSSDSSETAPDKKSKADAYVAPFQALTNSGAVVTDADIAEIKAIDPRAFYAVAGDNGDDTKDDQRKGLDFRRRERRPFEYFANDVDALLCGGAKFSKDGKLYISIAETGEIITSLGELTVHYFDSWTIAWFEEHDASYIHLDKSRCDIDILYPPKESIEFCAKVYDAVQKAKGKDSTSNPVKHYGSKTEITSGSVHVDW